MGLEAFNFQDQAGIQAAFMCNHRGEVCIAFSDPVYAKADAIMLDKKSREIHVLVHESMYFVSKVSDVMASAFERNQNALLTSIRSDGSLLELSAPIQLGRA